MADGRRRAQSEPFIEDAHRFPEDRKRERRPSPPDQDARRRKTQQRRRRNSVFQYIAILFMAAFVLLLYTFMMERRQSQQQIDDLKQSASAYQTLQGLMDENSRLKEEKNNLENQVQALENQLADAQSEQAGIQAQVQEKDKAVEAMHWFWQLNDASIRGRTTLCKEIINAIETANLQDYLPKENITGTDRYSPYDRYQEIRGRVIK